MKGVCDEEIISYCMDSNGVNHGVTVELSNPKVLDDYTWQFDMKDLSGKVMIGDFNETVMYVDKATP